MRFSLAAVRYYYIIYLEMSSLSYSTRGAVNSFRYCAAVKSLVSRTTIRHRVLNETRVHLFVFAHTPHRAIPPRVHPSPYNT